VKNFHVHPPGAPPAWDVRQKNSRKRAPEPSSARGTIRGAQTSRIQLNNGLRRTIETPISLPAARTHHKGSPPYCPNGFMPGGRSSVGGELNRNLYWNEGAGEAELGDLTGEAIGLGFGRGVVEVIWAKLLIEGAVAYGRPQSKSMRRWHRRPSSAHGGDAGVGTALAGSWPSCG